MNTYEMLVAQNSSKLPQTFQEPEAPGVEIRRSTRLSQVLLIRRWMRCLVDRLDEAETAFRMEHFLDGEGDFVRGE